jgi:hypothetical protein
MRRRMLVHAANPDALVASMDEAERRFRIWPGQEGVIEDDRNDI